MTDQRFSQASGPVKIIAKDGKVLKEPEIVQPTGSQFETSPYRLKRREENAGKPQTQR